MSLPANQMSLPGNSSFSLPFEATIAREASSTPWQGKTCGNAIRGGRQVGSGRFGRWAQNEPDNSRRSMGNLHPDSYTAGRATHGSNRAARRSSTDNTRRSMGNLLPDSYTAGRATHGSNRSTRPANTVIVVPQPYYPSYDPYYYRRYRPLVVPAKTLYGPRAVRRFMGW